MSEAARSEAFAAQADRSRELAAGYLQQAIAQAAQVRNLKALIDLALASISIPFRWAGTRLELQNAEGNWVSGPDLRGPGVASMAIDENGHLVASYTDLPPADLGLVRPEGDFHGPAAGVDGNFLIFDGSTGKRGKDSGKAASDFAAAVHTHTLSQISDASDDGRSLISAADYAAMRVLLELVKGTAAGNIPVLDGSGKLSTSVLPESVLGGLNYQTGWNASTNSPSIPAAAAGNKGWYYIVTTAGTTNVGGVTDWQVGDWVVSNGSNWGKVDSSDQVNSVAGLQGTISGANLKNALAIAVADITDASANGRSLISALDYSAMRILLSLVPGTHVQAYSAFLAAIAGLTPTNGNIITGDGATWKSAAPAPVATPTLIVRDEKPNNTGGGSSVMGAWTRRDLNTVAVNSISGASLASNQITLPAGTYEVDISAPAFNVGAHKIRLFNVTDGIVALLGSSETTTTSANIATRSVIKGTFTIAASKVFKVDHYAGLTQSGSGFGAGVYDTGVETYTIAEFKKVA